MRYALTGAGHGYQHARPVNRPPLIFGLREDRGRRGEDVQRDLREIDQNCHYPEEREGDKVRQQGGAEEALLQMRYVHIVVIYHCGMRYGWILSDSTNKNKQI